MIKTIQFESAALGSAVDVNIIEPTRFTTDGRCHTLFALHGMTGKHTDWVDNARLDDYVADLPVVTVLPSASDSFYMDSELGAYETLVSKELVAIIDQQYPTIPTAKGNSRIRISGARLASGRTVARISLNARPRSRADLPA